MPEGMNTGRVLPGVVDAGGTVVNRYLDELYDRVWLAPGGGIGDGNAVEVIAAVGGFQNVGVVKCTSAGGGAYRWSIGCRENWRNHFLSVSFTYTSPVGSTANFDVTWVVTSMVAPAASYNVAVSAASYPGPATANDLLTVTTLLNTGGAGPLTSQNSELVRIVLARSAADANVNDFLFLFGELRFYRA